MTCTRNCVFLVLTVITNLSSANGAILTLNNNGSGQAQFSVAQEAIDAAAHGDTILVAGSPLSYGNITVTKRIHLNGPGAFANEMLLTDGLQAKFFEIYVDTLVGVAGPSGSVFDGLEVESSVEFSSLYPTSIRHVEFVDCKLIYLNAMGGCTGLLLRNCLLTSVILFDCPDCSVSNNIFHSVGAGVAYIPSTNVTIANNLFLGYDGQPSSGINSVGGTLIQNNIFWVTPPSGYTTQINASTFFNNLTYQTSLDTIPFGTNSGSGNLVAVDPLFAYAPLSDWDPTYDFRLAPASPGKFAGTDGSDIGPFGGEFPLDLIPGFAPFARVIPDRAGNNGQITVRVRGTQLPQAARVVLAQNGSTALEGANTTVLLATTIHTTFVMNDLPIGLYDALVIDTLLNDTVVCVPFTVEEVLIDPDWNIQLLMPFWVRAGQPFRFHVAYRNSSNVDINIPPCYITAMSGDALGRDTADKAYDLQHLALLMDDDVFPHDDMVAPGSYLIPLWSFPSPSRDSDCAGIKAMGMDPASPEGSGPSNSPYSPNGCSNPFPAALNLYLSLAMPFGLFQTLDWQSYFQLPCTTHDNCYETCYDPSDRFRAKQLCDAEFFEAMMRTCRDNMTNPADLLSCYIAASHYYAGVTVGGYSAFGDSQDDCADPDAPLPSPAPNELADPDCDCTGHRWCATAPALTSWDPNAKYGLPLFQNGAEPFFYAIQFENLAEATAPAQTVTIVDSLDTQAFDFSTFRFLGHGWGAEHHVTDDVDRFHFHQQYSVATEPPLIVDVQGTLDTISGLLSWRFTSLDAQAFVPTEDPLAGFLPPNDSNGSGEGIVFFSVQPRATLVTGDTILNTASILFDQNPWITTPTWMNIIDKDAPNSQVATLPGIWGSEQLPVAWSGSDGSSGVHHYSVFVSVNGAPYVQWISAAQYTSATFFGEFGNTYSFYSVATDSAGNAEQAPATFDAITTLDNATSTDASFNVLGFTISPNPAFGTVQFENLRTEARPSEIIISDVTGRVMATLTWPASQPQLLADVSNYPLGVYIVQARFPLGMVAQRLVRD